MEGAPFSFHAFRIFFPVFEQFEACSFTHLQDLFSLFTARLLEAPCRRIPEVKEIKNARIVLFMVEEVAILNSRERPLLPIDGSCLAVNLAMKFLCSEIVRECALRGRKTTFLLWQANRDVYDNL